MKGIRASVLVALVAIVALGLPSIVQGKTKDECFTCCDLLVASQWGTAVYDVGELKTGCSLGFACGTDRPLCKFGRRMRNDENIIVEDFELRCGRFGEDFFSLAIISAPPSAAPTIPIVVDPTVPPSLPPSVPPTLPPTDEPTIPPTGDPTVPPSIPPTLPPTDEPTVPPTDEPTVPPTDEPTVPPTDEPTVPPTDEPTVPPTTAAPTEPDATLAPTPPPTDDPTMQPTTASPTLDPTTPPTTSEPTQQPTTLAPTLAPSVSPTNEPTRPPLAPGETYSPTTSPTQFPTLDPTTAAPTQALTPLSTGGVLMASALGVGSVFLASTVLFLGYRVKKNREKIEINKKRRWAEELKRDMLGVHVPPNVRYNFDENQASAGQMGSKRGKPRDGNLAAYVGFDGTGSQNKQGRGPPGQARNGSFNDFDI